jgi:hypothetical protein
MPEVDPVTNARFPARNMLDSMQQLQQSLPTSDPAGSSAFSHVHNIEGEFHAA